MERQDAPFRSRSICVHLCPSVVPFAVRRPRQRHETTDGHGWTQMERQDAPFRLRSICVHLCPSAVPFAVRRPRQRHETTDGHGWTQMERQDAPFRHVVSVLICVHPWFPFAVGVPSAAVRGHVADFAHGAKWEHVPAAPFRHLVSVFICVHLWFPLPLACRPPRSGYTLPIPHTARNRNMSPPLPSVRLAVLRVLRVSVVKTAVAVRRPPYASRASLHTPTCNRGHSVPRRHPRQPTAAMRPMDRPSALETVGVRGRRWGRGRTPRARRSRDLRRACVHARMPVNRDRKVYRTRGRAGPTARPTPLPPRHQERRAARGTTRPSAVTLFLPFLPLLVLLVSWWLVR